MAISFAPQQHGTFTIKMADGRMLEGVTEAIELTEFCTINQRWKMQIKIEAFAVKCTNPEGQPAELPIKKHRHIITQEEQHP